MNTPDNTSDPQLPLYVSRYRHLSDDELNYHKRVCYLTLLMIRGTTSAEEIHRDCKMFYQKLDRQLILDRQRNPKSSPPPLSPHPFPVATQLSPRPPLIVNPSSWIPLVSPVLSSQPPTSSGRTTTKRAFPIEGNVERTSGRRKRKVVMREREREMRCDGV